MSDANDLRTALRAAEAAYRKAKSAEERAVRELAGRESALGGMIAWFRGGDVSREELEARAEAAVKKRRLLGERLKELQAQARAAQDAEAPSPDPTPVGPHTFQDQKNRTTSQLEQCIGKVETLIQTLDRGEAPQRAWRIAHLAVEDFRTSHAHLGVGRLPKLDARDAREGFDRLLADLQVAGQLVEFDDGAPAEPLELPEEELIQQALVKLTSYQLALSVGGYSRPPGSVHQRYERVAGATPSTGIRCGSTGTPASCSSKARSTSSCGPSAPHTPISQSSQEPRVKSERQNTSPTSRCEPTRPRPT